MRSKFIAFAIQAFSFSTKTRIYKSALSFKPRFFSSSRIMSKQVISSPNAPKAIGPYSQAIKANGFVFVSGQLGIDPATGNLKEGLEAQTTRALENIGEILKAAGISYEHVVKTTILLKDINDFAKVNQIYETFFQKDPPARATYAVAALPKGGLVEIEAVAVAQ